MEVAGLHLQLYVGFKLARSVQRSHINNYIREKSCQIMLEVYIIMQYMFLMRDEKEGRKKQTRSNKHTR